MKELLLPFLAIVLLVSCEIGNMNDMQPNLESSSADLLSEGVGTDLENEPFQMAPAGSCEDDCIEPGSEIYYPVSDMASVSVGRNTKSVSYSAYNTETDFVVEVTYAITAGPAKAKATLTIAIDGNEVEFTEVSSGSTVSHMVPLAENWAGCDEVAFSVVQKGLGTPITFSESYDVIPVCEEELLEIGMEYQGGKIAYILQPEDPGYVTGETHGIIAAPNDQSTGAVWGCPGILIGTSTALGTGAANTNAIVSGCPEAGTAARICNDLDLNGYSDWYLPSRDELDKLYQNRALIGGFGSNIYWSSSEGGNLSAWFKNFIIGNQDTYNKLNVDRVRAVRAF